MNPESASQQAEQPLFNGSVDYIKGALSVVPSQAVITPAFLALGAVNRRISRAEVVDAREEKHGLARKIVFQLTSGEAVAVAAPDHRRLKAAADIFMGRADSSSLPASPTFDHVPRWSLWLAVFMPLIGGFIMLVLGAIAWGDLSRWRPSHVLIALVWRLVFDAAALQIDYLTLQKRGFEVVKLGLAHPPNPGYLFSRARVFKRGKVPAVIWALLMVGDILSAMSALGSY